MHFAKVENHFWGGYGIVGGHIPIGGGIAFANKYQENDRVTACFFGDGYAGLPNFAPFDKILVTAGATSVPQALKEQLKVGGKILAPLQDGYQKLILLEKTGEDSFETKNLIPVRFVPMTGKAQG